MDITLTYTPRFIESSKSNIKVVLTVDNSGASTGTTTAGNGVLNLALDPKAYIELYTVPIKNVAFTTSKTVNTLTDTLQRPFINDAATFDISRALNSLFINYNVPNSTRVQKDESAYIGYFFKYGYISYNAQNEQVKNFVGETAVHWCLYSAFENNENFMEWVPDFNEGYSGKWLTNIPNNHTVHVNEDVLLSAMIPKNIDDDNDDNAVFLKADLYYTDGTSALNRTVQSFVHHSGGMYTFNFKPSLTVAGTTKPVSLLSKYTVWLDYMPGVDSGGVVGEVQNYIGTASATVYCETGFSGNPATASATASSEVSQADANQKAYTAATAAATRQLVCAAQFASTRTATANCPTGQTGPAATGSATRYSSISQADADQLAQAAAQAQAVLNLRCSLPTSWNATATVTASCPTGYIGQDVTVTVYTTSTVSQADADAIAQQAALDAATAQLQCTVDTSGESFACDYGPNDLSCFNGNMIGNMGTSRPATQAEARGCWIVYTGPGDYCGTNPY